MSEPDSHVQDAAWELSQRLRGEVRFSQGDRALYATDSSNYRQVPVGLVLPKDAGDVVAAMEVCRRHGLPILSRGAGTSLAGQTCNAAVILDFSKYMRHIVELDPERKRARVQPGIPLDDLNRQARKHRIVFGPDPSTHAYCAIGGMIGNNACGVHSVLSEFAGTGARTSDNLEEMEILTYDGLRMRVGATSEEQLEKYIREGGRKGEIYRKLKDLRDRYAVTIRKRFPSIPRRVSGFNLDELLPEKGFQVARALAGTEGTCVTILEATLILVDDPPMRALVVLGFPDVFQAADLVPEVREFRPIAIEGLDDRLIEGMKKKHMHPRDVALLPEGKGWLLVEFGGFTQEEANRKAEDFLERMNRRPCPPSACLYKAPFKEEQLWNVRESGLGGSARIPGQPDTWEGWEDSAVAPENLGSFLRDFRDLLDQYDYTCPFYGHFGQGLVHTRIDFDLKSQPGVTAYRKFGREAAELVLRHGGSLSGEHGDGQSRGEFLEIMFGEKLVGAFREFKAIWDPENKMNPGKVTGPEHIYERAENLRLGADYHPAEPVTEFRYPEDKGSFAYAMERCVGVGKCRQTASGTMCPSYMATREEKHSTRGRARLLFEMLNGGGTGQGPWKDESVREALHLCLACKACKSECPMKVDMATYKAEFLSHHYRGRLRPPAAYSMGLIHWAARVASKAPGMVNFFTQTEPFSGCAKKLAGISPERTIPAFAPEPFKRWFGRQPESKMRHRPKVLLWPDTFNNFFKPETARAAAQFLWQQGWQVEIPRLPLCCGRPLYDFGMLDLAQRQLRRVLAQLRPQIEAGVPVVGLEPSCLSVFRDEMGNLFPHDKLATRLREQVFTLAEFIKDNVQDDKLPHLEGKAVVHRHCHHQAILNFGADQELLEKLGLELEVLDSGCCGMAGSFGFEEDKYKVSVSCGERVLLPAVRSAGPDTLIIADGFSCRGQIEDLSNRQPLHLAEVLRLAMDPHQLRT